MAKPITEMSYEELTAAINKADSLPEEVRQQHFERYQALCSEAASREIEMCKFPAHAICDPELREITGRLLRDVHTLSYTDKRGFRKAAWTILSDLMAICLVDPNKVLDFFGYKEVGEDADV